MQTSDLIRTWMKLTAWAFLPPMAILLVAGMFAASPVASKAQSGAQAQPPYAIFEYMKIEPGRAVDYGISEE